VHALALQTYLTKQDGVDAVHAEDVGEGGAKKSAAEGVAVGAAGIGVAWAEADEGRDLDGANEVQLDFLELNKGGDDGGAVAGRGEMGLETLALLAEGSSAKSEEIEEPAGPEGEGFDEDVE